MGIADLESEVCASCTIHALISETITSEEIGKRSPSQHSPKVMAKITDYFGPIILELVY